MDAAELARKMAEGLACFNHREFYEAHEHWEDAWNELDDPARRWVQGLIQIATGLHKLERGRPDVCRTLFVKALTKLEGAPATYEGVDLARAIAGARRILSDIEAGGSPRALLALPAVERE